MKKTILALILAVSLIIPAISWGAATPGSCVQTVVDYTGGFVVVEMACTGNSSDGSLPTAGIPLSSSIMALIEGTHYLYTVSAYPTTGGTAPDAADVFIMDANGEDLLGSTDGGTTANKGANLIHATLKKVTIPYSHYLSMHYYPPVVNTLTLKVSNQATASANWTIKLVFVR